MHPPHPIEPAPLQPLCPRCDYDLSGTVATWSSACPQDGSCPECGLAFRWRDVMLAARWVPAWFIEHRSRGVFTKYALTAARTKLPWRFWRQVRIEFPIRARRIWLFAFLAALACHLLAMVGPALETLRALPTRVWNLQPTAPDVLHVLRLLCFPYSRSFVHDGTLGPPRAYVFNDFLYMPYVDWWLICFVLGVMTMPVGYLTLVQTMARLRLRRAHILRIWAYSLGLLPPFLLLNILLSLGREPWNLAGTPFYRVAEATAKVAGIISFFVPPRLLLFLAFLFVLCSWWSRAATHYLRLPRADWITLASWIITALVLVITSCFCNSGDMVTEFLSGLCT